MSTAPAVHRISRRQVFSDERIPLSVRRVSRHEASPVPHGHDFQELVIIVDGWGRHRVEEAEYDIRAGEIFVLSGSMIHNYPDARNLSLINVLFDGYALGVNDWDLAEIPGYHGLFEIEPRMLRMGSFRNRLRLDLDELAGVVGIVSEIEAELRSRREGYRFLALAHFRRLVGYLSRRYSERPGTSVEGTVQLSRVLSHIERHYAEPVTVATLCRVGRMSRSTLMRRFRAVTGSTPVDCLIRRRVGEAQRLLRQSDLSITEIGLRVGFCDGNYFTRQFRRVTGTTPSRWRRG